MKSLVIHSLPRSGGTMLERLFDSQPNMVCFAFLFRIDAQQEILEQNLATALDMHEDVEKRQFNNLKRVLQQQYIAFTHTLTGLNPFRRPDQQITEQTHVSGIPIRKILDGLSVIALSNTLDDLFNIEYRLCKFLGIDLFSVHYTRCIKFAPEYLKKKNAYWLEITRHPYDRIMSERLAAPGRKLVDILRETQEYFEFIDTFRHDRFLTIKYENFCQHPEQELEKISDWLGQEIKLVPLLNIYGEPFYPNTSQSVFSGKSYMSQNPEMESRISALDPTRWRDKVPTSLIAAINDRIEFGTHYPRIKLSRSDRLSGCIKLTMLETREHLRNTAVSLFDALNLNISRKSSRHEPLQLPRHSLKILL